jgi:hypothetical protein
MGDALRRLGQGLRALFSFALPVDEAAARAVLSPSLFALFKRMRRSEQQHSLRVMRTLRARGYDQPDLLTAALLHDSGKARHPLTVFGRTVAVLVRAILPKAFARWSEAEPRGWRRPFAVAVQHPAWSAEDMASAGASDLAVTLARRHQDRVIGTPGTEEDRLLAALQAADDLH